MDGVDLNCFLGSDGAQGLADLNTVLGWGVNGAVPHILCLGILELRSEYGFGRSVELVVRANKCLL
jgi:hypothetical protein